MLPQSVYAARVCVSVVFSHVLVYRYLLYEDARESVCVLEREKGRVSSATRGLMGVLSSFILIAVVADLSVTLATVAAG